MEITTFDDGGVGISWIATTGQLAQLRLNKVERIG